MHADHITGTGLLKKLVPGVESVISKAAGAKADVYLEPGDHIKFGKHQLEVRGTPGHTGGCVTYVSHEQGCAFTGKICIAVHYMVSLIPKFDDVFCLLFQSFNQSEWVFKIR